ncbi:transposase family protein, partial [Gelidibacter salicanalis]|nr:transposase family protein [Gelidibacter salicanalis]
TTQATLDVITHWFLTFGFPTRIRSDNGPQFRTQFETFCHTHGIEHATSSPYIAQSNFLAEAAVKNVKMLLAKCDQTG